MQPFTRPFGYHLCLGGGVLNTGQSRKDLDLYFLPLCDGGRPKPTELFEMLQKEFGRGEPIKPGDADDHYYEDDDANKVQKWKFRNGGNRIDAFIWL